MQQKIELFGTIIIKLISLLQKLLFRRIFYTIIIIIIIINSRSNLFFYELRPKHFCVYAYLKFVGYISQHPHRHHVCNFLVTDCILYAVYRGTKISRA